MPCQEQVEASPLTQQLALCRVQDEQHANEVSRFQEELAEAHSQLQILQKHLDEELAKQPLTNQEVWSSAEVFFKNENFICMLISWKPPSNQLSSNTSGLDGLVLFPIVILCIFDRAARWRT